MKITVPSAASASLASILTDAQEAQILASLLEQEGKYNVTIQVLGAQDVYYEYGADSATATGVKVASGATVTMETDNLGKIRLIAASAPNTDVRVSVS